MLQEPYGTIGNRTTLPVVAFVKRIWVPHDVMVQLSVFKSFGLCLGFSCSMSKRGLLVMDKAQPGRNMSTVMPVMIDQDYIQCVRKDIEGRLNVSDVELRIAARTQKINELKTSNKIRSQYKAKALENENADDRKLVLRILRQRELLDQRVEDVLEAARVTNIAEEHKQRKRRRYEREDDSDVADAILAKEQRERKRNRFLADVILRDATMHHDGSTLNNTQFLQLNDFCVNCEDVVMDRNVYESFLVCPRCGFRRKYLDTSMSTPGTWKRNDTRNPPKCLTHYLHFLLMCQAINTSPWPREFLDEVAWYCWIAGARKSTDINKDMIHEAQRRLAPNDRPNYSISLKLLVTMRGHVLKFPPRLTAKMLFLFGKMWPVFSMYKEYLEKKKTRANMSAFKFITRVFWKLLGHDVYLPVLDKFKMDDSRLKHGWFMRFLFQELGWKWEDLRIVSTSDEELDWFEAELEAEREEEDAADDDVFSP